MTTTSPGARERDLAEQPTRAAQVSVTTEPARVRLIARHWLAAEGTVPPGEAHYLIAMIGVLGSVAMGIGGAVLTLRIARQLAPVAVAELMLGLIGAVLVIAGGHLWRQARPQDEAPGGTREPAGSAEAG